MSEQLVTFGKVQKFALLAASIATVGSVLTLWGWAIDCQVLKSIIPGRIAMNPVAAVIFIFAAATLALMTAKRRCARFQRVALGLSSFIVLIGCLCLGRTLSFWRLSVDRLLFVEVLGKNQMAPNTALQFILLGAAFLTLHSRRPGLRGLSQSLILMILVGSMTSLIGYGFGSQRLYGIDSQNPMSLNSAVLFGIMATGMLCAGG